MASDCIDICNLVCSRLEALGFDLGDDGDHGPIIDALTQVEFVRKAPARMNYFFLFVDGDVTPILSEPFATEEERDAAALALRKREGKEAGGIFAVQSEALVEVDSYGGGFYDEDDFEGLSLDEALRLKRYYETGSAGWIDYIGQGDIVTFTGRAGTDQSENHTGPIQLIEEVDDDLWHVVFTNGLDIQARSDELSEPEDEEGESDEQ